MAKPVWETPNPKNSSSKLSDAKKRAAQARAEASTAATQKAAQMSKSAKALTEYIKNPKTGYSQNLNKDTLDTFVNKNTIPAGQEMYRSLTPGELARINEAKLAGQDYRPGQVRSVGGAADLQSLGSSIGKTGSVRFGGANDVANTIAQITAMEKLKGIQNVNRFGNLSELTQEGLLGPQTRYKVISQTPATPTTPGIMRLGAYANSILGPLGYLSLLRQGGEAFTAKKPPQQMY